MTIERLSNPKGLTTTHEFEDGGSPILVGPCDLFYHAVLCAINDDSTGHIIISDLHGEGRTEIY